MGARVAQTVKAVRAYTLCQLEERFGACLPQTLFPKAAGHANSRDRLYTRWLTFWSMLWQGFNPKASGREVVRQIQALLELHDGPSISEQDGAYCRAKARLPLSQFPKALAATAQAADRRAPAQTLLQSRPIKAADGTTLTLNDTPKNRAAYPALHGPKPNFPMLRVVVLFSLLSGAILSLASGNLHAAELPLFSQLIDQLVGETSCWPTEALVISSSWPCCRSSIGASISSAAPSVTSMAGVGSNAWASKIG